jgi:RNA polymerase sigma-70 factor (ECF subfamily)
VAGTERGTPGDERLRLIRSAAAGDGGAFEAVVGAYAARLRWLIRLRLDRALRARLSADDLLQETMLVASQRIRHLVVECEPAFWSWLCRVAEDRIADARRRHLGTAKRDARRERALPPESAGPAPARSAAPSGPARRLERRARLEGALSQLPEAYREVIVLRIVEGLGVRETARLMGRTPGAVRVLLARAVRSLGRLLPARDASGAAGGTA